MTRKFKFVARQIFHPIRLVDSLQRRFRKPKPQFAEIGPYQIHLPVNSQVLNYRSAYHLYDTALGQIASILKSKYPGLHAIDIGANVGDTAALIRESVEIPVLCIEGDPSLLPFLTENVARLNSAHDLGNNACLVEAVDAQGSVRLRSLQAILTDYPEFESAKLLKIDTEGFDFDILRQSLEFIQKSKPVVFFEYDPHFRPEEPRAGLEAIEALISAGYSDFIYFDNYGNYLLHGVAVYYFDICALHQEDADLVSRIRSLTQR